VSSLVNLSDPSGLLSWGDLNLAINRIGGFGGLFFGNNAFHYWDLLICTAESGAPGIAELTGAPLILRVVERQREIMDYDQFYAKYGAQGKNRYLNDILAQTGDLFNLYMLIVGGVTGANELGVRNAISVGGDLGLPAAMGAATPLLESGSEGSQISDIARRVLVVGEDTEFEYSTNLALAHPDWEVVGTSYGLGSNVQNVLDVNGNLTRIDEVDATRLGEGSFTGTRQFNDIVFNGPERSASPTRSWRLSTGDLVEEVLQSSRDVLESNGSIRFSSSGYMPAVNRLNDIVVEAGWPTGFSGYKTNFLAESERDFAVNFTSRRTNGQEIPRSLAQIFWYVFMSRS
jgi:hypothetical protein